MSINFLVKVNSICDSGLQDNPADGDYSFAQTITTIQNVGPAYFGSESKGLDWYEIGSRNREVNWENHSGPVYIVISRWGEGNHWSSQHEGRFTIEHATDSEESAQGWIEQNQEEIKWRHNRGLYNDFGGFEIRKVSLIK